MAADADPTRDRTRSQDSPPAPSREVKLQLGPRLGLGGGPELAACLLILILFAVVGGVSQEAQSLGAFDGPFGGLFDSRSVAERAPDVLAEAIRMRTTNPPGDERKLARRFAAELRRAGVDAGTIDTPSAADGRPRAAVWGRLRGKGQRPALALLSHLDTVPAEEDDWSVDPFAGEIWDGFVWGRGALDAKGVAVSHLMTMIAIAESGLVLDRDLVFLTTPEEETGGRKGAGWLVTHHPELLRGVGYLLTEGGGIEVLRKQDAKSAHVWGISVVEKSPCWLELRTSGPAGPSASRSPNAAVPKLVAALDRIRRVESPVRVTKEVEQMFTGLAPIAAEWDRAGYLFLETTLKRDEGFRRRFLDDPDQNALVRNTVSITVLEGAPATARAEIDARLLPGESCAAFAGAIRSLINDPAVVVEEVLSFPAVASPADTPLYKAIERVAAAQKEPGLVVAKMSGELSDAHWFRERGIIAYGFVPRGLTSDERARQGGVDERISLDALKESIQLTIEIARALDEIEDAGEIRAQAKNVANAALSQGS